MIARRLRRHALVVETDPATRQLSAKVLRSCGYDVVAVDNGVAAVMATRDRRPDLILIDMQLRDVTGAEALAWLRSQPLLKATPIILLAANARDAMQAHDATILLEKPLSRTAIEGAIRDAAN